MFRKVSWHQDPREADQTDTWSDGDAEKQETNGVVTELKEINGFPAEPEEVHIEQSSDTARRSSVVSYRARQSSIVEAITRNDKPGSSIQATKTSTGQMTTEGRQCSIYSIKAAQNSSETGIASVHEEDLPKPVQDFLDAQSPGAYKFTVTEKQEEQQTKDEKATVSVEVAPLRYADRIARKEFLDDYTTKFPMPDIQGSVRLARFRYGFFTVYRRLFAIVFTANMIAIIVLASRSSTTYSTVAIGMGSNIFAAVLARHDNLINAVISIIHLVPLSWPIYIRKRLGKIYCHAGIHSGCGASAAVWYFYFIVLLALQPPINAKEGLQAGIYLTTGLIFTCLLTLIAMSHPTLRSRYHDIWENTHRYIGWFLTITIWTQVFLLCAISPDEKFHNAIPRSPLFWLVLGVTILLIYPWAMMRKRTFIPNQLSSHALRLEFSHKLSRTGSTLR